MKEFDQEQLIKYITASLDQSVGELDSNLQLRLDEIRHLSLQRHHLEIKSDENLDSLLMATRVSLDDSIEELDPQIKYRLDEIRKTALSQSRVQQRPNPITKPTLLENLRTLFDTRRFTIPAGAFATACVLVTAVSLFYLGPNGSSLLDEDIILFASTDEIELYENLEFYEWLAENGLPN